MNRRSFFSGLAALVVAPKVLKAKSAISAMRYRDALDLVVPAPSASAMLYVDDRLGAPYKPMTYRYLADANLERQTILELLREENPPLVDLSNKRTRRRIAKKLGLRAL